MKTVLTFASSYVNGNIALAILYLLAALFLSLTLKKTSREAALSYAGFVLVFVLAVLNPLIGALLPSLYASSSTFYRLFWVFPLLPLSGIFLAAVCRRENGSRTRKLVSGLLIAGLSIGILGTVTGSSYLSKFDSLPENKFVITRSTLDISGFIAADPTHRTGDVVLAPTEVMVELECYDMTIVPAIGRDEYLQYGKGETIYSGLLNIVLEGSMKNYDYVNWNLYSLNVKYVVMQTNFGLDEYMGMFHYEVLNRSGAYTLYRRIDTPAA